MREAPPANLHIVENNICCVNLGQFVEFHFGDCRLGAGLKACVSVAAPEITLGSKALRIGGSWAAAVTDAPLQFCALARTGGGEIFWFWLF